MAVAYEPPSRSARFNRKINYPQAGICMIKDAARIPLA
jgi:hypothetical protein